MMDSTVEFIWIVLYTLHRIEQVTEELPHPKSQIPNPGCLVLWSLAPASPASGERIRLPGCVSAKFQGHYRGLVRGRGLLSCC